MKKTIKVSISGAPLQLSLDAFKDLENPLFNEWDIFINDPSKREADCWFIIEDVPIFDTQCKVSAENIFFLAAETAQSVSHIEESSYMKHFLSQFGKVYTFHQYLDPCSVPSIPFLPWMINSNHGDSIWATHERDVDFFLNLDPPLKTKLISVICSKQQLTDNHRMRLRFVEYLKVHFGDSLDWFGNGVETVAEKWEALAPYKYTIVLENQSRFNVLTEKIGDAYLAHTYPFYWGAPNIHDFFSTDSLTTLNIEDIQGSIAIIESTLESGLFEYRSNQLCASREIVLKNLNFLNRILVIADKVYGTNPLYVKLLTQNKMREQQGIPKSSFRWLRLTLTKIDRLLLTNFSTLAKELYILLRYNRISRLLKRLK